LRERREDIPLLARYFLEYFKQGIDAAARDFETETVELMSSYPWPGNVRELRNVVERMLVLHRQAIRLGPNALPEEFNHRAAPAAGSARISLAEAVNAYEAKLVREALREAGGVQTRAAELLGTTRRILKYRMEKLNIRWNGDQNGT
jgi:DNA-binding NtrC family response regulator